MLGALEAEGFQPGDEIEVGGVAFELDPERGPDERSGISSQQ